MNKKICVATPVDFSNFGNRLQNYAVHEICKKIGLEPTTLAVEYCYVLGFLPKHKILEFIDRLNLGKVLTRIDALKSVNKAYSSWKFTNSYINTRFVKKRTFDNLLLDFDYYGIGGDQILAPFWKHNVWFALFPNCLSNRKICFAPSFGSDALSDEYMNELVYDLKKIRFLAIREQSGVNLVKRLGVEAVRICDPVVILTADEWKNAADKSQVTEVGKTALVYFLGNPNLEYYRFIKEQTQKSLSSIIDVSRTSKSKEASCNPLSFLSYIINSEIVYTDSYHAILLSLILSKPVVIFERIGGQDMNTRIKELIERYHLECCVFDSDSISEHLGYYDFSTVNAILEQERMNAKDYYVKFDT